MPKKAAFGYTFDEKCGLDMFRLRAGYNARMPARDRFFVSLALE
jgi:hypothetical protein